MNRPYDPDDDDVDEDEDETENEPEEVPPPEDTDSPPTPIRRRRTPKAQLPIPLAEVETVESLKGAARFTRSVSLGGRNDVAHFSVEMPFAIQPGWSLEQMAVAASDAFFQCKAVVFEQAGIEFTTDEHGVLHEVLHRHFEGAEREDRPERGEREPARAGGQERSHRPRDNGRYPHPSEIDRPEHVDEELWDDLVDNFSDWYDNRKDKVNGRFKNTAPDFKRAEDGEGIWLKPFRRRSASTARR